MSCLETHLLRPFAASAGMSDSALEWYSPGTGDYAGTGESEETSDSG